MNRFNNRHFLLTAAAAVWLVVALPCCPSSNIGSISVEPVEPQEGVATNITLSVYSDGWGDLLDTINLATEGPAVIDVHEDEPYYDPPAYYIYATADGFYTELYYCTKGDTIDVDLDAVPERPDTLAGVIFARQSFFADCYFADQAIQVTGPNGDTATITTDAQGRYGLGNVPLGTYTLSFSHQDELFSFEIVNTAGTDYEDLAFFEPMQAAAPNLYLYPETEIDVRVQLGFPAGGHVIESDPPYRDGWDVRVRPDGIIDGAYGYLFYEANLPQEINTDAGWLLNGGDLEAELRSLLARIGFVGREIDDFVEYWVPVLEGSPWYGVYPQDPESLVTLEISPAPVRVLRTLLLIRPFSYPMSIPAPPDPGPFVRDGFVAVEWGVLRGI